MVSRESGSEKAMVCPLCRQTRTSKIHEDRFRNYFSCQFCNLIFVSPAQYLSSEDEKARYDLHQNSPDDHNYRRFLSRIFIPMKERLAAGSYGLDFGSGPGPTLCVMFEETGHKMVIYDHFYANDPRVFNNKYDFITATEVVEHLHNPRQELDRLWACLKPGGWLGIMTKLALDQKAFARWHYKNDLTHICFFSQSTFQWLACLWQAELIFANNDAVLLNKRI